jgi:hypothetical protein
LKRSAKAPVFLLLVLISGCATFHRSSSDGGPVISIFNAGEGIAARPADLTLSAGQQVVFSNHSDYEISLDLDFGSGETETIGTISPLANRRISLVKPGEVRYILHFASARNFGMFSGRLLVEESPGEKKEKEPSPDQAPEPSPSEPVII